MTYWTWNGHKDDEPTLHVFSYGLINLIQDDLVVEEHKFDDPPPLKPEVLKDIEDWGGVWCGPCLQVMFDRGNDTGAMLWKLKYTKVSKCTSPDVRYTDSNNVEKSKCKGLNKKVVDTQK